MLVRELMKEPVRVQAEETLAGLPGQTRDRNDYRPRYHDAGRRK
jgi:hypothetical protein